jgi:hypothetical protein
LYGRRERRMLWRGGGAVVVDDWGVGAVVVEVGSVFCNEWRRDELGDWSRGDTILVRLPSAPRMVILLR